MKNKKNNGIGHINVITINIENLQSMARFHPLSACKWMYRLIICPDIAKHILHEHFNLQVCFLYYLCKVIFLVGLKWLVKTEHLYTQSPFHRPRKKNYIYNLYTAKSKKVGSAVPEFNPRWGGGGCWSFNLLYFFVFCKLISHVEQSE